MLSVQLRIKPDAVHAGRSLLMLSSSRTITSSTTFKANISISPSKSLLNALIRRMATKLAKVAL